MIDPGSPIEKPQKKNKKLYPSQDEIVIHREKIWTEMG